MRRILFLVIGSMLAALPLVVAEAAGASGDRARFEATSLSAAEEVPGPGDADGFGLAGLVLLPRHDRICYALGVRGIAPATAAHIHRGPVGVAGPVVVGLEAPTDGFSADCVAVDGALLDEIVAAPEQFYVNVHNAEHPAGAVRGQLGD